MREITIENIEKLRIEIKNIENTSTENLIKLEKVAMSVGKTRIGRIASFLEVEKMSYSEALKAKQLKTTSILSGDYNFILTLLKSLNTIGIHKSSAVATNDERTAFNRIIDSKTISIAHEILKTEANKSCNVHPVSGILTACSKLINKRNYSASQILDLSKGYSIIDIFCEEYSYKKSKNRSGSFGAMEIERISTIAK